MYFKDFPKIIYDFRIAGKNQTSLLKDITRNIRFRRDVLSNISVYDEYDIVDGETPEIIAEKVYGNSQYHWIVMLTNDRYDYIDDFPLAERELVEVISAKYPDAEDDIHHYEDENGFVVNSTVSGATSVSNADYERRKNEEKRRIKIVSPALINKILTEYKDLL